MDIYDIVDGYKKGNAKKLEDVEKILLEVFAKHSGILVVERWVSMLIYKMCETESGIKPESIVNDILGSLSEDSMYYAFSLLNDTEGTRIVGYLPPYMELKIKNNDTFGKDKDEI